MRHIVDDMVISAVEKNTALHLEKGKESRYGSK